MNPSDPGPDLFWQAYRYVAREMSRAEQEQFEEQLGQDQSAREAVANVVQLSAAVQSLPASTFRMRSRGAAVFQRIGWMSLGVAASALVMLGWHELSWKGERKVAQAESDPDPQVALAWSPADQDAVQEEDAEALTSSDLELAGDFSTPPWMTAVLAADKQDEENTRELEIN